MNEVVTLFFALLALASFAYVAATVAAALAAVRSPAAAERWRRLRADHQDSALRMAAAVTSFATLGSLYLSEVIGYPPCTWCWVQRGFMYPLAIVLVVAAASGRSGVRRPARVWALLGATTSAWHVAIERVPALQGTASSLCDPANPCTLRWVEHFGFVTIPVMALAAFLLAAALLSLRPAPVPTDHPHPEVTR